MQTHRLRGLASEYAFATRYYELIDDEKYSLITPTIDTGWDFMVSGNGIRIQVKRHTPNKRYNPFNLDLRRKRNYGTGNYTGLEFDYLAIHDVDAGDFIITHVSNLFRKGKFMQSVGIRSLPNEGFQPLYEVAQTPCPHQRQCLIINTSAKDTQCNSKTPPAALTSIPSVLDAVSSSV